MSSTHSEATAGLSRVMMKKGPKSTTSWRSYATRRTVRHRLVTSNVSAGSRVLDYGSDRPPRRESVCGADERGGEKVSALGEAPELSL